MMLLELADDIEATANEVMEWSASSQNDGPFSQEIHIACAQVCGAFGNLAKRLRARNEQVTK
jgi:hypothetical protein